MTRTADPGAAVADLAAALHVAVSRLRRCTRVGADGLTPSQLSVLVTVEAGSGLTLGELAAREGVSAPTATKLVGALVEAGLIDRRVDPGDRRSALLSLAPAGAQRLLAVRREIKSLLARRLATLTPAEREVVARAVPVLELLASSDRD